jgi:hypothetical protein
MYCILAQRPHLQWTIEGPRIRHHFGNEKCHSLQIHLKRCKTRAVSNEQRVKLTVYRANKQVRHILCFWCTEWLWNAAVNEHVNSRAYRRNLGATEVRGKTCDCGDTKQSSLFPVSQLRQKTMYLKFAVRAGNPCSHRHACHFTLQKHKNLGHAADCVQLT